MAGKKPIVGILKALDEELGTRLFREEVPRGVTITAKPKRLEPVRQMYHGTNEKSAFDTLMANQQDLGISLTTTPQVADDYAFYPYRESNIEKSKELGQGNVPGPRVMPVVVDPGNVYRGFPENNIMSWYDPQAADMIRSSPGFDPDFPHIQTILDRMDAGEPLDKILTDLDYHSFEYKIDNPYRVGPNQERGPEFGPESGHAMTVIDPKRVVPQYSPEGQNLIKERGMLAAEKPISMSDQEFYNLRTSGDTPDEFITRSYDPIKYSENKVDKLRAELPTADPERQKTIQMWIDYWEGLVR